jgi:hypothetical protein
MFAKSSLFFCGMVAKPKRGFLKVNLYNSPDLADEAGVGGVAVARGGVAAETLRVGGCMAKAGEESTFMGVFLSI